MAYADEVLADSPYLYWRFGDAATPGTDSSGNSRPVTTTEGNPTESVTGLLAGDSDTAFSFTASDGQSRTTETGLNWTAETDHSLELWFKGTTTGQAQTLIGKKATRDTATGYAAYFDASNNLVARVATTTNAVSVAGAAWLDGNPHHLVITRLCSAGDPPTLTVYIDGSSVGAGTSTDIDADLSNSQPLQVGMLDSATPDGFVGTIDEVAYYSSALSATRVTAHYNAGIAVVAPTTIPRVGVGRRAGN